MQTYITKKKISENVYVGVLAPEQKTVEPDHGKGGTELEGIERGFSNLCDQSSLFFP